MAAGSSSSIYMKSASNHEMDLYLFATNLHSFIIPSAFPAIITEL